MLIVNSQFVIHTIDLSKMYATFWGGVEEACNARYRFFFVGQLPRQVVQRYRLVIVVVLLFHIKPVYVK